MSDPYSNYFSGWFNPNLLHRFSSASPIPSSLSSSSSSSSASDLSFLYPYGLNLYSNYNHYNSSPPSPPLREALPLLSLSPTKPEHQNSSFTAMEVDKTKVFDKEDNFLFADDETVTVALHLGLPSPSSATAVADGGQILRLSAATDAADKEGEEEELVVSSGSPAATTGNPLNREQEGKKEKVKIYPYLCL
ncbi:hypothetical protein U1Q18_032216 [Sarracenia purpurea var. burkii]